MNLNAFAAAQRLRLYERLQKGLPPDEGVFSDTAWREGKVKGALQMGATRYGPDRIWYEFIYPDPGASATVLTVEVPSPERIVFLPVPAWVVESIWQGEIDGSYGFESEAREMVAAFLAEIEPAANTAHFGPRQAKRRE